MSLEKYKFTHKNFKILDWIKHSEILNYYSKSSISVVPSKWQEPFGRTAMGLLHMAAQQLQVTMVVFQKLLIIV